jgi:hypothetical protein
MRVLPAKARNSVRSHEAFGCGSQRLTIFDGVIDASSQKPAWRRYLPTFPASKPYCAPASPVCLPAVSDAIFLTSFPSSNVSMAALAA